MPTEQNKSTIAAASVDKNLLTGSQYLYCPFPAYVEFGLVGDTNAADLTIDLYTGQDTITEDFMPSAQNRSPIYPDDFTLNDYVGQGEMIKIRVRNTHATLTRDLFWTIKFTQLG